MTTVTDAMFFRPLDAAEVDEDRAEIAQAIADEAADEARDAALRTPCVVWQALDATGGYEASEPIPHDRMRAVIRDPWAADVTLPELVCAIGWCPNSRLQEVRAAYRAALLAVTELEPA